MFITMVTSILFISGFEKSFTAMIKLSVTRFLGGDLTLMSLSSSLDESAIS
jgi:hypothetical protein